MIIKTIIALLITTISATSQILAPDAHWGRTLLPPEEIELKLSLDINRFTEFDSGRYKYNDIDETTGFNLFELQYSNYISSDKSLLYTVAGGFGFSADQPSRFFQNDFLHHLVGISDVPVDKTSSGFEASGGFALTKWFDGPIGIRYFLHPEATASTIYNELSTSAGVVLDLPLVIPDDRDLRLSALTRESYLFPSMAYENIAENSHLVQFGIALKPAKNSPSPLFAFLGNPEIGSIYTIDSGLFLRDGNSIKTRFMSFYFDWSGIRLETWNDGASYTDYGPTYGFALSIDLFKLHKL